MKYRIFTALEISSDMKNEILNWKNSNFKLPVKWIDPKNLHITITPPFYTESPKEIIEKLKLLSGKILSFDLKFTKVSTGPKNVRPRLIWAVGEESEELIKLKSEIENVLGLKPEKRKFVVHLTLARINPENIRFVKMIRFGKRINWIGHFDNFVLTESKLKPEGVKYNILKKISLQM